MAVKATAKNIKGSPQKVRRILDLVRGRPVEEALQTLRFLPSPMAQQVAKVVQSAAANAENNYMLNPADLHIVAAHADDGMTLRRFRPRARGRVGRILKRYSHITVVVDEKES